MAASIKTLQIGIIAEDDSDVKVLEIITRKILEKRPICFKKMVGRGGANVRRKCSRFASDLKVRGCSVLVVLHDLDRGIESDLRFLLEQNIKALDFRAKIVLIPVEELEAWLLSDPEAIKRTFKMKKVPKITRQTHTIASPKEFLEKLVNKNSNSRYVNTIHNSKIAEFVTLDNLMRCPSFVEYPKVLRTIS